MFTGNPLSVTSANIATYSKRNENNLATSLLNLSTGKRVNSPSDSVSDFFYSESLKQSSRSSQALIQGIQEGIVFTDVASSVGESVFNSVTDMRDMVRRYYQSGIDADEKSALVAEFNAVKSTVQGVQHASRYDGQQLMSDNGGDPFKSVSIDARNLSTTLDICYSAGDIADVSALTLGTTDEATESAGVDVERGKAGSYLAKTSAYYRGLNAHLSLTENKVTIEEDTANRIVEADVGTEYVKSMNLSIRNQASMAMMAQANMYRMSVTQLF